MKRLFLIVCVLLVGATSALQAASDGGASYNLLLKYKLSEDWFLISRSNLASRFHYEDHFFGYTGLGLGYNFDKNWSVRVGYRHARIRPGEEWLDENRPYAEAYYANIYDGFRATNRSRFEFRFFDYREDDVRFRNEVVVEAPWEFTSLKLKPYIEEEFFYGLDKSQFEANWLGGGLSWRPMEGVKLKIGYRWVHQRIGENWSNRNVIVTGVNIFF